jgi:hypothetical protein
MNSPAIANTRSVLTHIKGAMLVTGRTPEELREMTEGSLLDGTLIWVWNVAVDAAGKQRDLRFWLVELLSVNPQSATRNPQSLDAVINKILPVKRQHFPPGEVRSLLQIEWQTLARLRPELNAPRGMISREALAGFLRRRWLGQLRTPHSALRTSEDLAASRDQCGGRTGHGQATETGFIPSAAVLSARAAAPANNHDSRPLPILTPDS